MVTGHSVTCSCARGRRPRPCRRAKQRWTSSAHRGASGPALSATAAEHPPAVAAAHPVAMKPPYPHAAAALVARLLTSAPVHRLTAPLLHPAEPLRKTKLDQDLTTTRVAPPAAQPLADPPLNPPPNSPPAAAQPLA
eukprot:scaffold136_cov418-Prasinococcus_capsulatus_cf.AAC.5